MSYEEEDTCMSYEEEDTCMSYEEEDTRIVENAKRGLLKTRHLTLGKSRPALWDRV